MFVFLSSDEHKWRFSVPIKQGNTHFRNHTKFKILVMYFSYTNRFAEEDTGLLEL